jgi:hypothetical protein
MKVSDSDVRLVPPGVSSGDCVPAVLEALAACRAAGAGSRLLLPPGELHFYPDSASEAFLALSNNDGGMRRVAFLLQGFSGLVIEGQGTRMIFHGGVVPFHLADCADITLRGFSVDWERAFHLEAEVIAADAGQGSFDLLPSPECLWEIRDGRLCWVERELPSERAASWDDSFRRLAEDDRWEAELGWNVWFDPKDRAIARGSVSSLFRPFNRKTGASYRATALGDGAVRISGAGLQQVPQVGWVFVDKGGGQNRKYSVFSLIDCTRIRLEEVTLHHSGGMGIIAMFCEEISLIRCAVTPSQGRMVSTTADATHFVHCRGRILLEDCRFEQMLDDGINVHGNYFWIEAQPEPDVLVVRPRHPQHEHTDIARPGDTIGVTDPSTFATLATAVVASVERRNGTRIILRLEQPLASGFTPAVVENLSWQADLEMRGCLVRGNRARAALFGTRGVGRLTRNRFEFQSMSAILVEVDADLWHETGPLGRLEIEENTICGWGREFPNSPAISITPELSDPTVAPIHREVSIRHNHFHSSQGRMLNAASVDQLIIVDNQTDSPERI